MSPEDVERLKSIHLELDQQLSDGTPPIMILASISDEDIDFIRSHLDLICWGYRSGQSWSELLLTYSIIDLVYEQYAQAADENTNLWPLVIRYLSKYGSFDRMELVNLTWDILTSERYHLPSETSGKAYLNTILLNSSSKHYSKRFFDFVLNQYNRKLGQDVQFDLVDVALAISKNYEVDRTKVNQMSHSFGLMIKNSDIFPDIFDRIINKIDQRRNGLFEYDLGRWESAFDEWYSDASSSRFTRNKAQVSIDNCGAEHFLLVRFPSNKGVPLTNYNVRLFFGKDSSVIKFTVVKRKGIGQSIDLLLRYPLQNIQIMDSIRAIDSADVELLNVPASDYRFFNSSGRLVGVPSSGQYKVLIRYGLEYDIPELYKERISDDVVMIITKLEKGVVYHIGKDIIRSEEHVSKSSFSIQYPSRSGRSIVCDGGPIVLCRHPIVSVDDGVENIRITMKDFAGRYLFNDHVVPIKGVIDINNLIGITSGVFTLNLSYEKYRLASVRYLVIDGIDYESDIIIKSPSEGQLSIVGPFIDQEFPYTADDMFAFREYVVNGKTFRCGFRTPNIFFNPSSDRDADYWIKAGIETFDTNDLGSSIGVSLGCAPDGDSATLVIRSPLGTFEMESKITNGVCFFRIADRIQSIQSKKYHFGLEVRYRDKLFPLFQVDTKGKYDVDVRNELAIITPYRLPPGCYARYEYHSFSEDRAGYFDLNVPVIFDLSVPCDLIVSETNTDTNDEIIIFEKKSSFIKRPNMSSKIDDMEPFEKACHLLTGNGCESYFDAALDILKELASENDLRALYLLGTIYMNGRLVNVDLQKASDYFVQYMEVKKDLNSDDGTF